MRLARKLPRTSVRISSSANLRIGCLVIVAGASGAGKSTFLHQLERGELEPEILSRLPHGASRWPQTNGFRIRGRLQETTDETGVLLVRGLVLHYDIMRIFETRISGYAEDPALATLAKAAAITAVIVRPSDQQLARHAAQKSKRGRITRLLGSIERRFRMAMRPPHERVYLTEDHRARHSRLAQSYLEEGFTDRWYDSWQSYLVSTAGTRLASAVAVRPVPGAGEPMFRLLAHVAANS